MRVACVLVTHLRAKVEMQRQPHLRDRAALVVDRSGGRPLVVDHFPAAKGVAPGMSLETGAVPERRQPGPGIRRVRLSEGGPPGAPVPAGSQRPGGGCRAGHGLRAPGRAGSPVRRRGPDCGRPAGYRPPVPEAPGWRGICQVPRLHRGANQPRPGNNPRPAGCRRVSSRPARWTCSRSLPRS